METLRIDLIDPNPFRDFAIRPIYPDTLADLKDLIAKHGILHAIHIRRHPTVEGRFQQAFGHHRLEAAKQAGRTELRKEEFTLLEMSDKDMLLKMAAENGESFNKGTIPHAIEVVGATVQSLGNGMLSSAILTPEQVAAEGTKYDVVISSRTRKDFVRYAPSFIPGKVLDNTKHPYTANAIAQLLKLSITNPTIRLTKQGKDGERASGLVQAALDYFHIKELGVYSQLPLSELHEMSVKDFVDLMASTLRHLVGKAASWAKGKPQQASPLDYASILEADRTRRIDKYAEQMVYKAESEARITALLRQEDPLALRIKEVYGKLATETDETEKQKWEAIFKDAVQQWRDREKEKDATGFVLEQRRLALAKLEEVGQNDDQSTDALASAMRRRRETRIRELKSEIQRLEEIKESEDKQREREERTAEQKKADMDAAKARGDAFEAEQRRLEPVRREAAREEGLNQLTDNFIVKLEAAPQDHSMWWEEFNTLHKRLPADDVRRMRVRNALEKLSTWLDERAQQIMRPPRKEKE